MWISKSEFFEMRSELENIKAAIKEQQGVMPNIIYDRKGRPYYKSIDRHGLIFYETGHPLHPWWGKEKDNMGVFATPLESGKKHGRKGR